jgi:hypothetical protein
VTDAMLGIGLGFYLWRADFQAGANNPSRIGVAVFQPIFGSTGVDKDRPYTGI